jgi:hypothetical protein
MGPCPPPESESHDPDTEHDSTAEQYLHAGEGIIMNAKSRAFVVTLLLAVFVALLLIPTAGAAGTQSAPSTTSGMMGGGDGSWCGGGIWDGSGSWGGTGMWGMGFDARWLADHPDALEAWLQLRNDHLAALQAWYDTYKDDLTSTAAQETFHDLWQQYWNDMKAFYEQYGDGAAWTAPSDGMWNGWQMGGGAMGGWDARHMWGTGYGAGWLTKRPPAFANWLAMRSRHISDANAWWQEHRADPAGTAAQADLQTMRSQHRAQVKSFYTSHGLTVTTARMRAGTGGWMGLGGMWGGWGW